MHAQAQQPSPAHTLLLYACRTCRWICAGSTALLECLAFKGTKHRDTLRVMQEVRQAARSSSKAQQQGPTAVAAAIGAAVAAAARGSSRSSCRCSSWRQQQLVSSCP